MVWWGNISIEAGSDEIKCANKSRCHVFTLHLIVTIRNRGNIQNYRKLVVGTMDGAALQIRDLAISQW